MATSPMAMWKYSPDRIHPIRVGDNDHIMRNRGDGGDWSSGGFVRRSQEVAQMSCARAGGWTWTLKLEAHAEMNPLKKTLGVDLVTKAEMHHMHRFGPNFLQLNMPHFYPTWANWATATKFPNMSTLGILTSPMGRPLQAWSVSHFQSFWHMPLEISCLTGSLIWAPPTWIFYKCRGQLPITSDDNEKN